MKQLMTYIIFVLCSLCTVINSLHRVSEREQYPSEELVPWRRRTTRYRPYRPIRPKICLGCKEELEDSSISSVTRGLNMDSVVMDALDSTSVALERERDKVMGSCSSHSTRRCRGKKRAPVNKFMKAIIEIERGVRDAHAMVNRQSVNSLKQQIRIACNSRDYSLARQLFGHLIYHYAKVKKNRGRKRRSLTEAMVALNSIRNVIGTVQFSKLMEFKPSSTLAFAIDTTGSMMEEIGTAKRLATEIIDYRTRTNANNQVEIDYILSPFNDETDPGHGKIQHGPVSYYTSTNKNAFLNALGKLNANGGGDCEEQAIEGIQGILSSSIKFSSPIYIFTDAGPKYKDAAKIEALKQMARFHSNSLNFFLSSKGCLKDKHIKVFKSLAKETGGMILYFTDQTKIGKLGKVIHAALIGDTDIPVYKIPRIKRSSTSDSYSIHVDNTMDSLTIGVMTDYAASNIKLYNAAGKIQLAGKIDTGRGAIFLVEKPSSGSWKLDVPHSAGDVSVTAKGVSDENIDFDFYFLIEKRFRGASKIVSARSPLKNQQATIIITVSAYKKTVATSLKIQIVDKNLKQVKSVKLIQIGRSSPRFKGTFSPPSHDFRLILEGKTRNGITFKRLRSGFVSPTSVTIQDISATLERVLTPGSSKSIIIMLAVHNYGNNERFTVKIEDFNKFTQTYIKTVYGVRGRVAYLPVFSKAPKGAKKGTKSTAVVSVIGQSSGAKASISIPLLVG